jgi:hypothetical protein
MCKKEFSTRRDFPFFSHLKLTFCFTHLSPQLLASSVDFFPFEKTLFRLTTEDSDRKFFFVSFVSFLIDLFHPLEPMNEKTKGRPRSGGQKIS